MCLPSNNELIPVGIFFLHTSRTKSDYSYMPNVENFIAGTSMAPC